MIHYIYTITDTKIDRVVYVGRTVNIDARMVSHKNQFGGTVKDLIQQREAEGCPVKYDLIIKCDDDNVEQLEKDFICYYNYDGGLLNRVLWDEFGNRIAAYETRKHLWGKTPVSNEERRVKREPSPWIKIGSKRHKAMINKYRKSKGMKAK